MEQFKKEVKKILMSKFRFGPITAENLVSGNSDIFEMYKSDIDQKKQTADTIAELINVRYESEDEDDGNDEEEE